MHRAATLLPGTALLAVAAATCWWVWLAWDRSYTVDAATGVASGPYEAWQVVGCGLSLVAVTALAARRLPRPVVVAVGPLAFTAAWSATAAGSGDGSGLWVVGAVLVLLGTVAGAALVAAAVALVARRRAA